MSLIAPMRIALSLPWTVPTIASRFLVHSVFSSHNNQDESCAIPLTVSLPGASSKSRVIMTASSTVAPSATVTSHDSSCVYSVPIDHTVLCYPHIHGNSPQGLCTGSVSVFSPFLSGLSSDASSSEKYSLSILSKTTSHPIPYIPILIYFNGIYKSYIFIVVCPHQVQAPWQQ